jgi:leucyl-tRNA synthetase
MVIAPEHPFVARLTAPGQAEAVRAYCEQSVRKSDLDRTDLAKEKTGVFTGSYAINPVNGEAIPIWVADYVLISYGTGAIMAVPAHDTRDFEFAQQFNLPIIAVVDPGGDCPDFRAAKMGLSPSNARDDLLAGRVAFIADGVAVNSGPYDGLTTPEFKRKIAKDLAAKGIGRAAVNYKLRDWLFSRQHFWGEPFPILHELDAAGLPNGRLRALTPADLPLDLPEKMAFDASHDEPTPPLDKAPHDWLYVTLDGKRYKRETNTMPQWAGSCWYYLRFLDPKNHNALIDPQVEKAWMPVDLYVGGAEHAVLHLLYARFWHKVLFDRGYVSMGEPFQKLVNQGMILGSLMHRKFTHFWRQPVSGLQLTAQEKGDAVEDWLQIKDGWQAIPDSGTRVIKTTAGFVRESYELISADADEAPYTSLQAEGVVTAAGARFVLRYVPNSAVEKKGEAFVLKNQPNIRVDSRAYKMSKSRGNVVNPDEVVREYGADSLRLYEMFMGPLEAVKPWSMDGVSGVRGFLDRVWRMILDDRAEDVQLNAAVQEVELSAEQNRVLHKTIKSVTADLEQISLNTAIARMMEFTNFFLKEERRPRAAMEKLVLLLAPLAPHIAEELWAALGHADTLAYESWPTFDEAALREDTIEVPVQINGKLRGRIRVAAETDRAALESAARGDAKIAELLAGKTVVKAIVVPGRMVNFVVK